MIISQSNRELLLDIAEYSIYQYLEGNVDAKIHDNKINMEISVNAGAFVSVYIEEKLRGCIGTFSEKEALYENIRKMAVSAAFRDSRFSPVNSSEMDELGLEISVLTPRKRIDSVDEIEIGRHGIYIISDYQHGTLLPQVAVKNNWNSIQFLEKCVEYKLGLQKSAWTNAELYTYEALVFSR